jgi:hypothetical protein
LLGLAQLRARVRPFSLVTLIAYLGVLMLVTFGHRCVSADTGRAQGECRKVATSPVVSAAVAPAAGEHSCPACAFLQQSTAIVSPQISHDLPALRFVRAPLPPAVHLRRTCSAPHSSRGPPAA